MPKWKSLRAPPYHIPVVGMQGMYHASVNAFRVSTKLIRSHPGGATENCIRLRPKALIGSCDPSPAFPSVPARVHVSKKDPLCQENDEGRSSREPSISFRRRLCPKRENRDSGNFFPSLSMAPESHRRGIVLAVKYMTLRGRRPFALAEGLASGNPSTLRHLRFRSHALQSRGLNAQRGFLTVVQ